jgi:hypothetical protein
MYREKWFKFSHFFLSFIALKKCTNLQDLWHPLKMKSQKMKF